MSTVASARPLAGCIALVTGASRGIGRAIAIELGRRGAALALCALDEPALLETARASGAERTLTQHCDLASSAEVAAFAARVERELGVPDLIVHNAGVVERERIEALSEAAWDHVLDVNLKAPFLLTRALVPGLRARGSGRIIFVGSISGTLGTPRLTAYCASKHGVIGLMRALAEELRDDGIQTFAVNPGSVDTDMLKGSGFPPAMTPADIAGVVAYLACDAPAAMTGRCVDVFG